MRTSAIRHFSLLSKFFIISLLLASCQRDIDSNTDLKKSKIGNTVSSNLKSGSNRSKLGTSLSCEKNTGLSSKLIANPAVALKLSNSNIVRNTDYIAVGVGGLRDIGHGILVLKGVSGVVTKAYLYWHGVTNSSTDVGNIIAVNKTSVKGINIGYSGDNCWGYLNSQAYRADVTALVKATGNGSYSLSDFGEMNPNGASLIVFYNDNNASNNRDVKIFDGNDADNGFAGILNNPKAPEDAKGWDAIFDGIEYTSGTANLQMHVSDGQFFSDEEGIPDPAIYINGKELVPESQIFGGNTVPAANNGPFDNGSLWDIRTFDLSPFLKKGTNTLHLTTSIPIGGFDCLGLIVALVDVPSNVITVAFDVKPQSCPNPLNAKSKGVTPAAILGKSDFNVKQIDVRSIKLNGLSPIRYSVEDVASPFKGVVSDCYSCSTSGPDGKADLTLKFNTQALIGTLGSFTNRQCISVTITGKLRPEYGRTEFKGVDKVILKK